MRKNIILAFCSLSILLVSCAKNKEKITANTLVIAIDTGSVFLSTGAAQVLNAICKNARSSNVDIAPEWTVDSNIGSFSPQKGKTTTFTAGSNAGSGKIYASYSGVSGKTDVLITTGAASASETLTLTVSPTPVSVSMGAAQSFTVTCKNSKNETVNITPEWSVDLGLGSFSATSGLSTTFTARSTAGTGKVYATYPGARGSADVSVVGHLVYSDAGATGTVNTWDSFTEWAVGSATATFDGSFTGDPATPEGTKCYKTASDNGNTYAGWGVFHPGGTDVNLSDYSGGHLVFWLKSNDTLKVELQGPIGTKRSTNVASTGGAWQKISLPITDFSGIVLTTMYGVFAITAEPPTGKTFYVDDVHWIKD